MNRLLVQKPSHIKKIDFLSDVGACSVYELLAENLVLYVYSMSMVSLDATEQLSSYNLCNDSFPITALECQ